MKKIYKTKEGNTLFIGAKNRSSKKLRNIVREITSEEVLTNVEWIKDDKKVIDFLKKEAALEQSNLMIVDFISKNKEYEIRKVTNKDLKKWIVNC